MTCDPDVLEVEVARQGRARLQLPEAAQLFEREAAVRSPDVDQALKGKMRRGTHHVRVRRLPDDLASGKHCDPGLVRFAQRDDDVAAAGEIDAESRVHLARER